MDKEGQHSIYQDEEGIFLISVFGLSLQVVAVLRSSSISSRRRVLSLLSSLMRFTASRRILLYSALSSSTRGLPLLLRVTGMGKKRNLQSRRRVNTQMQQLFLGNDLEPLLSRRLVDVTA